MAYVLRSARWIAADVLHQVIQEGDTVIDATLGNGHDTVMLAELVGEGGHVIGFDIQPDAVERTAARLQEAGLLNRCELYAEGHQNIANRVNRPVKAAVFNLGWLPGGDKSVTTLWETTHTAITSALSLLVDGGVCTVCAYPGHDEGTRELNALLEWGSGLDDRRYDVLLKTYLNQPNDPPRMMAVRKKKTRQKKEK